jgi:hypothetical protein
MAFIKYESRLFTTGTAILISEILSKEKCSCVHSIASFSFLLLSCFRLLRNYFSKTILLDHLLRFHALRLVSVSWTLHMMTYHNPLTAFAVTAFAVNDTQTDILWPRSLSTIPKLTSADRVRCHHTFKYHHMKWGIRLTEWFPHLHLLNQPTIIVRHNHYFCLPSNILHSVNMQWFWLISSAFAHWEPIDHHSDPYRLAQTPTLDIHIAICAGLRNRAAKI